MSSMRMLGALLLVASLALPAASFTVFRTQGGQVTKWPAPQPVKWYLATDVLDDVNEDALLVSLEAAFDAWEEVSCASINFSYEGRRSSHPGDGIFVRFETSQWDPAATDVLAYGPSEWNGAGTIQSAEVIFNAVDAAWTTVAIVPQGKSDIQGVATHEIGHTIGIGHSRRIGATMFFSVVEEVESERTLEEDDRNAACFIYPKSSFTQGQSCDACDGGANCAEGVCISWAQAWGQHAYCGEDCTSDAECDAGFECLVIDESISKQCFPINSYCDQAGANLGIGEFCWGHETCQSGLCLVGNGTAICSGECAQGCPPGMSCGPSGYCELAGEGSYGAACQEDIACQSALCIFFNLVEGTCTETCGENGGSCPDPNHQCYQGFCVPPGPKGNGAPCATPSQCRGTWCVDNLCTQVCGGNVNCPAGTMCVGGFCVGDEAGTTCSQVPDCPTSLACIEGVCSLECNPLASEGCPEGQVCEWVWGGAGLSGRCVTAGDGQGEGQPCDMDNERCRPDLVCAYGYGETRRCFRDCQHTKALGCGVNEQCLSLEDPSDPERGICVSEPDPEEPVADAGSSDMANVDAGSQADLGPTELDGSPSEPETNGSRQTWDVPTTSPDSPLTSDESRASADADGCRVSARIDGLATILSALCLGWALWRRRRYSV